jgi:hypothetical protein
MVHSAPLPFFRLFTIPSRHFAITTRGKRTHLVHDVFTLTELADYVFDCKSGRIFRERFYQFAGMFDEHDADVDQTVQD